jgi:4-hydroxy-tetrahydrodipicolinate reductase
MKIALVGYGKMGKEIEKIAIERGHEIVAKFSHENPLKAESLNGAEVAIDFSTPSAVLSNIHFLIDHHVAAVIGTTGWNNHLAEVTQKVQNHEVGLIHASNFSLGVNLFFKLNQALAKMMNNYPSYTARMEEIHHTEKIDAPSGTAITLAEGIIDLHSGFDNWHCPQRNDSEATDSSIQIDAIRKKDVKGTHTISYQSDIDTIRIEHEAHNRKGFALGAVIAAEWIVDKKGVFTMQDVLASQQEH